MDHIIYAKEHAEFVTITCLGWKHILMKDRFKDIITDSLSFLSKEKRVSVYGFVIMSNHFHLIWQMMGDNTRPLLVLCVRLGEVHQQLDESTRERNKFRW